MDAVRSTISVLHHIAPILVRLRKTLESWLGRRVKYYLSKRRPLCPNAARTKNARGPAHW
jgi:hypothetical protein